MKNENMSYADMQNLIDRESIIAAEAVKPNRKRIVRFAVFALMLVAACFAIVFFTNRGSLLYAEASVEEKPLRLHVLANSDSAFDQQLKIKLRDYIIAYLAETLDNAENKQAAMAAVDEAITTIEQACNEYVSRFADYEVKVSLSVSDFPEIDYGGAVFAAGQYDALRIVIGSGEGKNWWCVLFPPLCFVDLAAEEDPEAALAVIAGTDYQNESGEFSIGLKIKQMIANLRAAKIEL